MLESVVSFLASVFRTSTPILLAALGLVYSERAGIVNISTEGTMLIGALIGVLGSYYSGSAYVGLLFAMLSGAIVSLLFAFFTITLYADQTVVGTAINILAVGFTTTINRVTFGYSSALPQISVFEQLELPFLSRIPVLGEMFFSQSPITYFTFILVPISAYILNSTNLGLRIRSVGENPKACDTLGINVVWVRYNAVLTSGIMAGFAGCFVSMGQLSFFTENMIAGGGFMALAAVVFGNYAPTGAMFASILFGTGDAIKYKLQAANTEIPSQLLTMLPYIITIISICVIQRKSNKPMSSAIPYIKE